MCHSTNTTEKNFSFSVRWPERLARKKDEPEINYSVLVFSCAVSVTETVTPRPPPTHPKEGSLLNIQKLYILHDNLPFAICHFLSSLLTLQNFTSPHNPGVSIISLGTSLTMPVA